MIFEYNAHLNFDERIKLVADEITSTYPKISYDDAILAASNTMPIDDKLTNDDKFDRYYSIMRTIGKNNIEFKNVLRDAYLIYEDGLEKEIYINVMPEIINYVISKETIFPKLVN